MFTSNNTICKTLRIPAQGSPVPNVSVVVSIPTDLQVVSGTPSVGTYASGVWTIPTLTPNTDATISLCFGYADPQVCPTSKSITATIGTSASETNLNNNTVVFDLDYITCCDFSECLPTEVLSSIDYYTDLDTGYDYSIITYVDDGEVRIETVLLTAPYTVTEVTSVPPAWVPTNISTGGGDMLKSTYDTSYSGVVDNAELLQGKDSPYHLNRENHVGTQSASTIIDFQLAVSSNQDVVDNKNKLPGNPLIDDDTLTAATATNVASAESVKSYVDANSINLLNRERVNYETLNKAEIAAYMCFVGQSNGDGTQLLPSGQELIDLPNVFMLSRSVTISGPNWTHEDGWDWVNFSSESSELNLGFAKSGHYKNMTTEFAREWQDRIYLGENLPDLYITHMSYSGNGFGNSVLSETRYNPIEVFKDDRTNIWHGSLKLHKFALNNLLSNNRGVIHLGINNNQWEHDAKNLLEALEYKTWIQAFLAEHDKVSKIKTPYSYFVPTTDGVDNRFEFRDIVAEGLAGIKDRNVVALDPKEITTYDSGVVTSSGYLGIYHDDVHYNLNSHTELKNQLWNKNGFRGLLLTEVGCETSLSEYLTEQEVQQRILSNFRKTTWDAKEYISLDSPISWVGIDELNTGVGSEDTYWRVGYEGDKKYFNIENKASGYSFLFFNYLAPDTKYSTFQARLKAGSRLALAVSFCTNPTSSATFQNSGKEYLSLSFLCDVDDANLNNNGLTYASEVRSMKASTNVLSQLTVPSGGLPLGMGTSGITEDLDIKLSVGPGDTFLERTFKVCYKPVGDEDFIELFSHDNVDISSASPSVIEGGQVGLVLGLGNAPTPAISESLRIKSIKITSDE